MRTIQVQSQVTFDTLLDSLEQLSAIELDQITHYVVRLQAQRKYPSLSQAEADLLLKINQGIVPEQVLQHCKELSAKVRNETISPAEHEELMELVDEIEQLNAQRLEYLAQLAQLRQVSLPELMDTLEITPLSYE
jgi:hypothetical protein